MTPETWHVTWWDMVTQLPSSNGMKFMMSWRLGGKGWLPDWMNEKMNESINQLRGCLLNSPGYTGSVIIPDHHTLYPCFCFYWSHSYFHCFLTYFCSYFLASRSQLQPPCLFLMDFSFCYFGWSCCFYLSCYTFHSWIIWFSLHWKYLQDFLFPHHIHCLSPHFH